MSWGEQSLVKRRKVKNCPGSFEGIFIASMEIEGGLSGKQMMQ